MHSPRWARILLATAPIEAMPDKRAASCQMSDGQGVMMLVLSLLCSGRESKAVKEILY